MQPRLAIAKSALREHVGFDLGWLRQPVGATLLGASGMLRAAGKRERAAALLMQTHHVAFSAAIDRRVVERIAGDSTLERQGQATGLWDTYRSTIAQAVGDFRRAGRAVGSLVGSRILVVKAARPRERGIIVVDYTYVFPLLAGLFDLRAIAGTTPSSSSRAGPAPARRKSCCHAGSAHRVFVQTIEPRDNDFLGTLALNCGRAAGRELVGGPAQRARAVGGTRYRRHHGGRLVRHQAALAVLRALAGLRARGHRLKAVLVGY